MLCLCVRVGHYHVLQKSTWCAEEITGQQLPLCTAIYTETVGGSVLWLHFGGQDSCHDIKSKAYGREPNDFIIIFCSHLLFWSVAL